MFAGYHTHTVDSDGRGTPVENIEAAVVRGLEAVALTDHGPKGIGIGVAGPETFLSVKEEVVGLVPRLPQVRVLVGAETAVISRSGHKILYCL